MLRGIKTLHVRVPRQSTSALRVAEFLESHPQIERVYYPGLKSHPDHEVAMRQMRGQMSGGVISFIVKGGIEPARIFSEVYMFLNKHLKERYCNSSRNI